MGHASSFLPASIYAANAGEQGASSSWINNFHPNICWGWSRTVCLQKCLWVRRCHKHGVTVNGCFRLQLCQCPLPSGIPKRVPPITACIWDQRQIPLWWQKGSACACGCWPPHLTRTRRPAARATIRSRSRTQSFPRNGSDETIDRCELRQWAT